MARNEPLSPSMHPVRPKEGSPRLPRGPKRSAPTWKGRFVLEPKAGGRAQRVAVRFSLTQLRRNPTWATGRHLVYMARGDRLQERFPLYAAQGPAQQQDRDLFARIEDFASRTRHDPYQWRIVISPERGVDVDLTAITRRAMAQMEKDTGYQLDWVAANHYDTAHPHTHIVIRGVDREGQEVGLKRDYITRGFQYRVQDILTQDLGRRPLEQTLEHAQTLEHDYDGGRER